MRESCAKRKYQATSWHCVLPGEWEHYALIISTQGEDQYQKKITRSGRSAECWDVRGRLVWSMGNVSSLQSLFKLHSPLALIFKLQNMLSTLAECKDIKYIKFHEFQQCSPKCLIRWIPLWYCRQPTINPSGGLRWTWALPHWELLCCNPLDKQYRQKDPHQWNSLRMEI